MTEKFNLFAKRMQAEGISELYIETFKHYYTQLVEGQTGFIPETEIEPVESVPDVESFPERLAALGQSALPQTVFLKLNGGLGTSMGLEQAKSLLPAKDTYSFLDIISRYVLAAGLRLALMDSFATRADTLAKLDDYPQLQGDIPLDFVQHKTLKVLQSDLSPAVWPPNPDLEWCPPGHGDIYTSLVTSGMLDTLLQAGYEYAFVSNSDNLGAVVDASILGYFVDNHIPFMMEVADRTEMDRKGGHLAQLPDEQLILRESAQCPSADLAAFEDVSRHKYFNTNNLWIRLPALKALLREKNNILGLPMIRNEKTVDPRDSDSPPVYQLETAMGAAIAVFAGAQAVRVPRTRFVPIKDTGDLLTLWSDIYVLTDDFRVVPNPARTLDRLVVDLDPAPYKLIDKMEARFPFGAPSLLECEQLSLKGDIKFGREVTIKGKVQLVNTSESQREIGDGTVIENVWEQA